MALYSSTGTPHPSSQAFDPQEIFRRIASRQHRKKGTVTAAKIDFNAGVPTVDCAELKRLKTIRGDELALACYGLGKIGGHVRQ